MRKGSLLIVGTGITGVGQITLEAAASIEAAEQLFYIANDPASELWLKQRNATAATLSDLYARGKDRHVTYSQMTERIVAAVRAGLRVCVAIYGHPGVFVQTSHQAIRQLQQEGYPARMLPGVSADGCFFADVGFNPGDCGVQSFEATDFLLSQRLFDPTSGLLLWQIGVLGEVDTSGDRRCRPERLKTLTDVLVSHYGETHDVVVYYANTFPAYPPVVQRLPLERLPRTEITPQAMLFVPPLPQRQPDPGILRWFTQT